MKQIKTMRHRLRFLLICFTTVLFLVSCTKEVKEIPTTATTSDKTTTAAAILQDAFNGKSKYYISTYIDDGRNKTSAYKDYTFIFKTDGTIVSKNTRTGLPYYGSYFFDDEMEEVDIDFDTETILDELRGDWDILTFTNRKIDLVDDDDRLIFSKIG